MTKLNSILISLGLAIILLIPAMTNATEQTKPVLKPTLKFKTLAQYQKQIKEPGVLLQSDYVYLYAPKQKSKEAEIIFDYLKKAYNELYAIVGRHTEYIVAVYHFPKGDEHGWGGTGNCEIGYSYENLDLASQKEWQQYQIPHVSGYIEEMAHSFVHATRAQFGWEMVGWSIGIHASKQVANNPIFLKHLRDTRKTQTMTYMAYKKAGFVLPEDIPANSCDRIHAYLLWKCERKYGKNFWPHFFGEITKEHTQLRDALKLSDADQIRNKRYQITIGCFDRLEGLDFKKMLQDTGISLTADIKSLHPESSDWDRRLTSSDPANNIVYDDTDSESKQIPIKNEKPIVNINLLPPLHQAVYGGHNGKTNKLIEQGANINQKGLNGWTPLHMAAIGGHKLLSEYLLSQGADLMIKDDHDRTAIKLAEIFGHKGLTKFLEEKNEK